MRVLIHIIPDGLEISNKEIRDVEKTSIATTKFLQKIWKDIVKKPDFFEKLCLILQAHCLIYPLCDQSDEGRNGDQKYLVPCKIKKEKSDEDIIGDKTGFTFYFDFDEYLPEVIYHKLICSMLYHSTPPELKKKATNPIKSSTQCYFKYVKKREWMLEIDKEKSILKVFVVK